MNSPDATARASGRFVKWGGALLGCIALLLVVARLTRTSQGKGPIDATRGAYAAADSSAADPRLDATTTDARVAIQDVSAARTVGERAPGQIGSVSGTVFGDDGRPLAGAICTLTPGRPSWGFAPRVVDRARRTQEHASDAEGRFAIPVAGGYWALAVSATGYASWREDHLQDGDHRDVHLVPESTLGVLVRDSSGKPVADAEVSLLDDFHDLDAAPLASGATNVAGACVLGGLDRVKAYLYVHHPEYQAHFEELELIAGGPRQQDIEVTLATGVRITGRVRTERGSESLEDASVRVEAFSKGQSLILTSECDANGSFATAALFAPGEGVEITASARGFAESKRAIRIAPAPASGVHEIDMLLSRADRRVRGIVADDTGAPLEGVAVHLTSTPLVARGKEALAEALAAVTSHPERWRSVAASTADGRFEITGLATGVQYVILLLADDLAPSVCWIPSGDAGELTDIGEIWMSPCGSLSGTVRDESGAPVGGVLVRAQMEIIVTEADFESWRPSRWWRPFEARTRADGSFRFDQMASGSYDLEVGGTPSGSWSVHSGVPTGPIELVLAGAPTERAPTITLAGRVLDVDRRPIASAFVALFDAAQEPSADAGEKPVSMTFTGPLGEFKLDAARDGYFRLHVADVHGEHLDYDELLSPRPDSERLEVRLEASPYDTEPLSGLVLGPAGMPEEGIDVSIAPPENEYCGCISFRARTDGEGRFSFAQLADKDHRVTVSDPLGRYRSQVFQPARPGGYVEIMLDE